MLAIFPPHHMMIQSFDKVLTADKEKVALGKYLTLVLCLIFSEYLPHYFISFYVYYRLWDQHLRTVAEGTKHKKATE